MSFIIPINNELEKKAPKNPLEQMLSMPEDRAEERHQESLRAQERTLNVLERLLLRTGNTTHQGGS